MAKKTETVKKEETKPNELSLVKEEIKNYVDEKIRVELIEGIERTNKRVIREKNRTIAIKNLFMIILFIVIVFLLYCLNSVNYFDKYLNKYVPNTVVEEKKEESEPVIEEKIPTLDELKETYSYLLENVNIDEESIYLENFYSGNLSSELKKYFALNLLDFNTLTNETSYSIITDAALKESYLKIFEDDYAGGDFDFNKNNIRYIDKLASYITSSQLEKKISNIKREIIDIKVNDNEVSITTVEGLILNNKLYNAVTKEEILKYKNDDLINYQDLLNKITYVFKDGKLTQLSND